MDTNSAWSRITAVLKDKLPSAPQWPPVVGAQNVFLDPAQAYVNFFGENTLFEIYLEQPGIWDVENISYVQFGNLTSGEIWVFHPDMIECRVDQHSTYWLPAGNLLQLRIDLPRERYISWTTLPKPRRKYSDLEVADIYPEELGGQEKIGEYTIPWCIEGLVKLEELLQSSGVLEVINQV